MPAASLIDDIQVQVGYCGTTTAKLTVVALQDTGTLSVSCPGGSAVITVGLTGIGADNPSRVGEIPLYYAKVDISGLAANTRYTYTVSKNGLSVSGAFRTLPADSSTDFSLLMWTCENPWQGSPVDVHSIVRDYVDAWETTAPVLAALHIDDISYVDGARFWGFDPNFGSDSASGIALTSTSTDPCDTGLRWDQCVNWANWFGLFRSCPLMRRDDRLWLHRNLPLWAQWGDHEVAYNWLRGSGGASNDWYGPTAGYSTDPSYKTPGTADYFNLVARANWEALFGQASPPKLGASGQHWGATVGPLCITAADGNTFADGRHGLSFGTGTGTGRQADGTVNAGTGDTTLACYGTTQVGEVLAYHAAQAKPFNFMCWPNGWVGHNEVYAQWYVTESDDWLARATTGILNQSRLNGTTGKLAFLKGDTHGLHVGSMHADGTAAGLGGSSHSGKEIWEICPGTLNGSATDNITFQYKILQYKLRFLKAASTSRGRHLHGFVHVIVRASRSPQEVELRLIDTSSGRAYVAWSGYWDSATAGNALRPVSARKIAA